MRSRSGWHDAGSGRGSNRTEYGASDDPGAIQHPSNDATRHTMPARYYGDTPGSWMIPSESTVNVVLPVPEMTTE